MNMGLLLAASLALGPILAAAVACVWFMRADARRLRAARAMTDAAIERAGLEHLLRAPQWLALCWLSACLLATATIIVSSATGARLLVEAALAALAGAGAPWLWLRDRAARRQQSVVRELPGYLDLLTLGLEAGCAFGASLQLTIARSPPGALRDALERALQEMRAGRSRSEALQRLGERMRVPALTACIAAIVQAEATGVSLAPVMRAQALRGTQERFALAEKRAMEAPVKMLAPLVLCIFPCTFIVIGFPIAVRLFWGLQ
ncbi:MAG TPA: type II secretion system F family protein [Burkholderiaceae bacterium]|nr:type II secretion system F family protein [Burkholderiaceae bacterium]